MTQPGAHVRGYNAHSLGICYEGGLDAHGHPADTRTDFQKHSLRVLVMLLLRDYPDSRLCGHRDLSPDLNRNGEIEPEEWIKACPCFDAASILQEPPPPNPGLIVMQLVYAKGYVMLFLLNNVIGINNIHVFLLYL